jgi:hypothetical protein
LYVQLAIRADDDGFISPKGIMKLVGAAEDDLKVLLAKRFLLEFASGVIVIKHWLIHNTIRKDRYKKTRYLEEKSMLRLKENGAYTDYSMDGSKLPTKWQPNDDQMAAQVKLSEVILPASAGLIPEEEIRIVEGEEGKEKKPIGATAEYEKLCQWAEKRRGFPFVNRVKQYTAMKKAKSWGTSITRLKQRWEDLENSSWLQEDGFDWTTVVSSFDKRA